MASFRRSLWAILYLVVVLMDSPSGHASEQNSRGHTTSNLGKTLYDAKCSSCHGIDGKGDGNAAALLSPQPRDFTAGTYEFRTTESGSMPTDADLIGTIQDGLQGTSMTDWAPFLKGDSLNAVVDYVKSFSPRFKSGKPKPVKIGKVVPSSRFSIRAGKQEYDKLQCAACHGTDGKGAGASATDFTDDWGNPIKPADLTEPWTFRGGSAPKDIYTRLRTGLDGTPMPSYKGSANDRQMWDLANYVVSMGRKPVWSMNADELKAFYANLDKVNAENPLQRGKYLVETMACGYCHTPIRKDGSIMEDLKYAGGQRWDLYPFGNYVSYNLTSDMETGLGGWTEEELATLLTTGVRRDGSRMIPYPMPWTAYAAMSKGDLKAMILYLRSLPPVYNKIPPPKKENIVSFLWGKFRMLILKKDFPLVVYWGNAGTTKTNTVSALTIPPQTSKEEKRP